MSYKIGVGSRKKFTLTRNTAGVLMPAYCHELKNEGGSSQFLHNGFIHQISCN